MSSSLSYRKNPFRSLRRNLNTRRLGGEAEGVLGDLALVSHGAVTNVTGSSGEIGWRFNAAVTDLYVVSLGYISPFNQTRTINLWDVWFSSLLHSLEINGKADEWVYKNLPEPIEIRPGSSGVIVSISEPSDWVGTAHSGCTYDPKIGRLHGRTGTLGSFPGTTVSATNYGLANAGVLQIN